MGDLTPKGEKQQLIKTNIKNKEELIKSDTIYIYVQSDDVVQTCGPADDNLDKLDDSLENQKGTCQKDICPNKDITNFILEKCIHKPYCCVE